MKRTFLIIALLLITPSAWGVLSVETLQSSGDSGNRIDLVILGDGYRTGDQTQLTQDATYLLSQLWQVTPFKQYRNFFNVKLVHVISNENGADKGTYGVLRDTALGATYGCQGIDRLICLNSSAVNSVAVSNTPEFDKLIVLINDPKYGGAGGNYAVVSIAPTAAQMLVHEYGHVIGGLADEYEDPYPTYPLCSGDCTEPNVTTITARESIKWNAWIDPATPVPTPETVPYQQNVIGLFEGARYQSAGVYRPKYTCEMRAFNYDFCSVCAEAIITSIYDIVDPIDSVSPSTDAIGLTYPDGTTNLTVSYVHPAPDTTTISWIIDGTTAEESVDSLSLAASELGMGIHTVVVKVQNKDSLVRNDPGNLLISQKTWTMTVSCANGAGCMIDGTNYCEGDINPENSCLECVPALAINSWTADNNNTCSDGQFCTGQDSCVAGTCIAGISPCQSDDLTCTADCDEVTDACNVLTAPSCVIEGKTYCAGTLNPTNSCLECNPDFSTNSWTADNNNTCSDDGLFCNGQERCVAGECKSGGNSCPNDGLDCTLDCNESADRCNVLTAGNCLIDSVCRQAGEINPANACSECIPDLATDKWTADDSNDCSDGLFCTGTESCKNGVCTLGVAPCPSNGLECEAQCDEEKQECNVLLSNVCLIDGACRTSGEQNPANPCEVCTPNESTAKWTKVIADDCSVPTIPTVPDEDTNTPVDDQTTTPPPADESDNESEDEPAGSATAPINVDDAASAGCALIHTDNKFPIANFGYLLFGPAFFLIVVLTGRFFRKRPQCF